MSGSGGAEGGRPVVPVSSADGKQVHAVVVLPVLEIDTEFIIIFPIDLDQFITHPNFRQGLIVLAEHGLHAVPGPVGQSEDQSIELAIHHDRIDPIAEIHTGAF